MKSLANLDEYGHRYRITFHSIRLISSTDIVWICNKIKNELETFIRRILALCRDKLSNQSINTQLLIVPATATHQKEIEKKKPRNLESMQLAKNLPVPNSSFNTFSDTDADFCRTTGKSHFITLSSDSIHTSVTPENTSSDSCLSIYFRIIFCGFLRSSRLFPKIVEWCCFRRAVIAIIGIFQGIFVQKRLQFDFLLYHSFHDQSALIGGNKHFIYFPFLHSLINVSDWWKQVQLSSGIFHGFSSFSHVAVNTEIRVKEARKFVNNIFSHWSFNMASAAFGFHRYNVGYSFKFLSL